MEEMKGFAAAINAIGEKIIDLERTATCERYLKEEAERMLTVRINQLQDELNIKNDALNEAHAMIEKLSNKLDAVHAYTERMEEE